MILSDLSLGICMGEVQKRIWEGEEKKVEDKTKG